MVVNLETLLGRFNTNKVVDFLENQAKPRLTIQTLAVFGSVTLPRFDRYGETPGKSDVDLLALTNNHFDRISLPNFVVIAQQPDQAQAQGQLNGRQTHLFVLSQKHLQEVLDRFVAIAGNPYTTGLTIDDEIVLEEARRLRQADVLYGTWPNHEFFELLESNIPGFAFLRRDLKPKDRVNIIERYLDVFR